MTKQGKKTWTPKDGMRVRSKIEVEVEGGIVGSGRGGKPIDHQFKGTVKPGDVGFILFFDEEFRSGWHVQFDNGLSACLAKREMEPVDEAQAGPPPLQPWEE